MIFGGFLKERTVQNYQFQEIREIFQGFTDFHNSLRVYTLILYFVGI